MSIRARPTVLEEKVKEEIKLHLKEIYPDCLFSMPVQTGFGGVFLDIVCCIEGKYVEIEAKRKGKEPTQRQNDRIEAVRAAGGFADFIHGASHEGPNMDVILDMLEEWLDTFRPKEEW